MPKEDDGWSNNKPREGASPGKLPKGDEKSLNGTEKERPSTLITPLPLPQLQATPAPKPVQIPSPGAESPKAANGAKDRTNGQANKGEETMPMKETKVDLEGERKLLVNAGAAAIVLFAVVSYICYYTLGMGRN
ncbi:hypothetical protein MLD38_011273 [Melastoma candidum]|nr:hypothetical protein MLD38_011273 [Melastoma candidum]